MRILYNVFRGYFRVLWSSVMNSNKEMKNPSVASEFLSMFTMDPVMVPASCLGSVYEYAG